MGFFLPKTNWVLQTFVSTKQNFPAVCRCFTSTTSWRWAESTDPKAFHQEIKIKDDIMTKKKAGKKRFAPKPFSAFVAGSSKMRAMYNTNNAVANDSSSPLNIVSTPDTPLSAKEWEKLKEEYQHFKKFEDVMFDSMVHNHSPVDVAKSLLVAVAKRDGDIEYSYLVKYLTLCVFHKDIGEIYDIYNIMKAKYKSLEASAYSLLIKGLSVSSHWKETLVLLEKVKKVSFHSRQNYGDCIEGALLNQERNLAFELFHEMVAENLIPASATIKLFFDFCQPVKDDHLKNKCIDILYYLRENQIYPDESLMLSVKQWFESIPGENWKGNLTSMNNNSRQCPSCGHLLEDINLSEEEFINVKDKIKKDVIEGTDVFRNTSPQELERFQRFVNEHPPFDVVIDGLNVARTTPLNPSSKTLLDVVVYLAQKYDRLLVLGRRHMLKNSFQWKKRDMDDMQKKADFFFTDNMSKDDPFLLYATFHSGGHCMLVTRDLLRDHRAVLSDNVTRRLFFKWQRGHQMVVSSYVPGKILTFEDALPYDTVVQTDGNTWHIPYDDNLSKRVSYEIPVKWLCLQKK
ncbi:mitochondrial ribonuclease P catalytic subunit isoform X1 [Pantherophis guttatus]|uniref:Mitochondrial ribonuclease P catalytic subunit n=1 Tax=Pantherophis guttatus TaxID=94885 RepID=A0A6P9C2G8_PANGU|nr:mitochondrial ribonuclease P catalytic subunit isoform X1 [Pantherophis guttatus]XP_034273904.1 mitochondrial ribonuclease P catalytic subunit isoform X1 [Pantherophis guttatus]XP_034273905.1 mitochondrial ribonuclease P catalytic subunit isoform X1 [Pantherophis guttatus]